MTQPQRVVDACSQALSASDLSAQRISQYLVQRARGYESLGESGLALADLDRAVSLDPNSYLALDARAQYFDEAGKLAEAKRDEDAAFDLAPEGPERYAAKGVIYALAFDTKTAIDVYSEGIRHYPDAWTLYLDRGSAYHSAGDHGRALQDLDVAGRLAPDEYMVDAARGQMYLDEKQPLSAIKEYDLAMTKIKATGGGSVLLGRCQAELMWARPRRRSTIAVGRSLPSLMRGWGYFLTGASPISTLESSPRPGEILKRSFGLLPGTFLLDMGEHWRAMVLETRRRGPSSRPCCRTILPGDAIWKSVSARNHPRSGTRQSLVCARCQPQRRRRPPKRRQSKVAVGA